MPYVLPTSLDDQANAGRDIYADGSSKLSSGVPAHLACARARRRWAGGGPRHGARGCARGACLQYGAARPPARRGGQGQARRAVPAPPVGSGISRLQLHVTDPIGAGGSGRAPAPAPARARARPHAPPPPPHPPAGAVAVGDYWPRRAGLTLAPMGPIGRVSRRRFPLVFARACRPCPVVATPSQTAWSTGRGTGLPAIVCMGPSSNWRRGGLGGLRPNALKY
ncbi:hypothetical protein PVAP13_2KG299302 [Panicum virgatum]|uniref:Uncharacterized protein n=1 Tax=Panicum virgatum TaxID=38727 RepID=A0A8T0W4S7_PANVG|nr:hypothetical protein PVAP13_2KG299302 [Panicum virgatum]